MIYVTFAELEALLLLFTTPFMVFLIIGEMMYSHFSNRRLYTPGDTFTNLVFTSWNFINDLIFRATSLLILTWFNQYALFSFAERDWIYWLLLFLGQDLAYYALHYADHYCRFFWASHVTHHSSEKFNFTVAIRSSVFQPFYRFLFYIPLAFFGFKALDIFFMYAACQVYGFWVHTELIGKLHPFIEFVFVTPSHHRVHHGSNARYLDTNMGMVLIVWDRIFGTFQSELAEEPVKYGLTKNSTATNPFQVALSEWVMIARDIKMAPDWSARWHYVFGPPGWSHDGSRKTSREMKRESELVNQHEDFERCYAEQPNSFPGN
jgi:sterol desaturase/sphingolipid hydroxylase (fatty acid hydroxylase superfamily)